MTGRAQSLSARSEAELRIEAAVAQRFTAYALLAFPREVGGLLRLTRDQQGPIVSDLRVFAQAVSATHFVFDGADYARFNAELVRAGDAGQIQEWRALIHSHPRMISASPSPADDQQLDQLAALVGAGGAWSVIVATDGRASDGLWRAHYAQAEPVPLAVDGFQLSALGGSLCGLDALERSDLEQIAAHALELGLTTLSAEDALAVLERGQADQASGWRSGDWQARPAMKASRSSSLSSSSRAPSDPLALRERSILAQPVLVGASSAGPPWGFALQPELSDELRAALDRAVLAGEARAAADALLDQKPISHHEAHWLAQALPEGLGAPLRELAGLPYDPRIALSRSEREALAEAFEQAGKAEMAALYRAGQEPGGTDLHWGELRGLPSELEYALHLRAAARRQLASPRLVLPRPDGLAISIQLAFALWLEALGGIDYSGARRIKSVLVKGRTLSLSTRSLELLQRALQVGRACGADAGICLRAERQLERWQAESGQSVELQPLPAGPASVARVCGKLAPAKSPAQPRQRSRAQTTYPMGSSSSGFSGPSWWERKLSERTVTLVRDALMRSDDERAGLVRKAIEQGYSPLAYERELIQRLLVAERRDALANEDQDRLEDATKAISEVALTEL